MILRQNYLNELLSFQDKQTLIKVVTGVRRSGKSTLLEMFSDHLRKSGTPPEAIISLNFELVSLGHIQDHEQLNEAVLSRKRPGQMNYVILDEVQLVKHWEKAVNSLRLDKELDIYITGSNAYLLSSELSTLLSGRYVEVKMFPLSFSEYLIEVSGGEEPGRHFDRYLKYGGMPESLLFKDDERPMFTYLSSVTDTIIMKDVVRYNNVRDIDLLERVLRFVADNIGREVSATSIANYLTSAGRKTNHETIDNYLKMLEKAFIIYNAARFDVKGKSVLKTNGKYYFVDVGLRNQLVRRRGSDIGWLLENVVYLELLRRGCSVTVGKLDGLEIDFVAERGDDISYFQVTQSMLSEEVEQREIRPLQSVRDAYPKTILSLDVISSGTYDGIQHVNIIDFLLRTDL